MKIHIFFSTLALIIVCFLIIPRTVSAAICIDQQTRKTVPGPPCPPNSVQTATINDLETVFANIVTTAGILVGFAFFIMLIIGGTRYLLSGGDPKALQAAKGTITWAVIGLALFALSFTILLIIQAFTGVNITIFRITI